MIENEVLKAIEERSSTRDYRKDPVPADMMYALEKAALEAQTSLNRCEQKFFFITDRNILHDIELDVMKMAEEQREWGYLERLRERDDKVLFGAPLLIVIASREVNDYTACDSGIAAQTICLAAHSMGLGSVIMAAPDRIFLGERGKTWRDRIGMEPGWQFEISVAVGFIKSPKEPHEIDFRNIVVV